MTKLQKGIINAVSMILLEWTCFEYGGSEVQKEREKDLSYWHDKKVTILVDEDASDDYGMPMDLYILRTVQVKKVECLEVATIIYDEWDEPNGQREEILAIIPVNDPKRSCWDIARYASLIEHAILHD